MVPPDTSADTVGVPRSGEHGNVRMLNRNVVLVLVLALALAGCGGQSEVTGDDYTIFIHGGSLLPRGGDDALVEGTLTTRDGCVLLEHLEGFEIAYPVVWPSGTSIISEEPLTLKLPSGEEPIVGQVVSGGGGYHQASSVQVEVSIPAGCVDETGQVAVFNPDADLSVGER